MRNAQYTSLRSVQFPLYTGYTSNHDSSPKSVKILRKLIEEAQREEFAGETAKWWSGFKGGNLPVSSGYEAWKAALVKSPAGKEGQKPGIFLGHAASKLPEFLLPIAGLSDRLDRAPHPFRYPREEWKEAFAERRLAIIEHVSAYYHRPHLLCYDVHEWLRAKLPRGERALVWFVVPGRRGRLFEARSAFLRKCCCPDLSYHHYSDTARIGLYSLIDSHIYVSRVKVGSAQPANDKERAIYEELARLTAEDLKKIWALQWQDPTLDEDALACLHDALFDSESNAYAYTERHFFWFVEGGRERPPPVGVAARFRAVGTLCACADEVQRLMPDVEFWSCGLTHTKLVEEPAPEDSFQRERTESPSIDEAQSIGATVEFGYQWPYFFDRRVAALLERPAAPGGAAGVEAVFAPWMKCGREDQIDGRGMIGRGFEQAPQVSFLAYPRFFQSRVVTPPLSRAQEPTEGFSLAHVYQLVPDMSDDYLRIRLLYSGQEFPSEPSTSAPLFPAVLRDNLDAAKEYSSTMARLGPEVAEKWREYLEGKAPVVVPLRNAEQNGSVWFIGVGYSHRRSRILDPDIVSAPDLRAGFFAIFFVPHPREPATKQKTTSTEPDAPKTAAREPSGATAEKQLTQVGVDTPRRTTPEERARTAERLATRIELHKGRIVANIERILAKMAAELVEERDAQERSALMKAKLILADAMGPINRMMQLQRRAREEAEQLALSVGLPGSTLLEARDIAADMFRDGRIYVNRQVMLQASHHGFADKEAYAALAYFMLRFFRRDEELQSIRSSKDLVSRAAALLFEVADNEAYDVIRTQIYELCDVPLDCRAKAYRVREHLFENERAAFHAIVRIKETLHTAFKLNAPWNLQVANIALHTVAANVVLEGHTGQNFESELPFSHGQWLDAMVLLAQSYLKTTYLIGGRRGEIHLTADRSRYEVTMVQPQGLEERGDFRGVVRKLLLAFKAGLATGADPRLASIRWGDLSSAVHLFGSIFRFVGEDEGGRGGLFASVRKSEPKEFTDGEAHGFEMQVGEKEFWLTLQEGTLRVGLAPFGKPGSAGTAVTATDRVRTEPTSAPEAATPAEVPPPAKIDNAVLAATADGWRLWFLDHEIGLEQVSAVQAKLAAAAAPFGATVAVERLTVDLTAERLRRKLDEDRTLLAFVHAGKNRPDLRFSHSRLIDCSRQGTGREGGLSGVDLRTESEASLAGKLRRVFEKRGEKP